LDANELLEFAIENVGLEFSGGSIEYKFDMVLLITQNDRCAVVGRNMLVLGGSALAGRRSVLLLATGEQNGCDRRAKHFTQGTVGWATKSGPSPHSFVVGRGRRWFCDGTGAVGECSPSYRPVRSPEVWRFFHASQEEGPRFSATSV
jgi:hypothetical protein